MSHRARSQGAQGRGLAGTLTPLEGSKAKVRKATSQTLQQLLAQNRGVLGLIGLGALSMDRYQLTDMDLALKNMIQDVNASYLVHISVADQTLALARKEYPMSALGQTVSLTVFGKPQTFVALTIQEEIPK